jgi:UDP-3-O-[3-hydroxymyristoyl] N-acetylglucosamine deacetylase
MLSADFERNWTLAQACELSGPGLHTGEHARLRLLPAEQPGFFFRHQNRLIPVRAEYIRSTHYCTTFATAQFSAQTIEHVLAALLGLGYSAVILELEGPEFPILDGSARDCVRALQAAGRRTLDSPRRFFRPSPGQLTEALFTLSWEPADQLSLHYTVDYAGPPSLRQSHAFIWSPEAFITELADARTFVYFQEIAALQTAGLARGGSRENALVISEQAPAADWRTRDEPVRHKLLDLIGDLALLGAFPLARIRAERAGHRAHVTMVASWARSM